MRTEHFYDMATNRHRGCIIAAASVRINPVVSQFREVDTEWGRAKGLTRH
jgi:hypothetical protein